MRMSYQKATRPLVMSVSTTATRILPAQIGRIQYILRNTSANPIYLSPFPDVAAATGFPLLSGETLQFKKIDGDPTEVEIWAIAPAGASELVVWS